MSNIRDFPISGPVEGAVPATSTVSVTNRLNPAVVRSTVKAPVPVPMPLPPQTYTSTGQYVYSRPSSNQMVPGISRTVPPHSNIPSGSGTDRVAATNTSILTQDGIQPVAPSINTRPSFNGPLPVDQYTTVAKVDENLIEVDEDDLTQTQAPDELNAQPGSVHH